MRPSLAAAVAAFLLISGCGYIGGTLPPLANVPSTPQDLAATQRGATILAHFTVPSLTTETVPIKGALELDLRAGPAPAVWSEAEWAAHAQRIQPHGLVKSSVTNSKGGAQQLAEYQFSSAAWIDKEVIIAARVIGANGKASNWSAVVTVHVVAPLPKPTDVTPTPLANGIRLTWHAAGNHFRVLRRAEGADSFTELAVTTGPEYLDTTAEFGKKYTYVVLAFTEAAPHQEAQSDISDEAALTYKDTFAPAAPTGLHAIASAASIELTWDSNAEPDLAGYRVYRSTGGAFEKIADVNEIPAYSDRAVERGKTYRYAVAAVDKSGNESGRSAEVEGSLQ